MNTEEKPFERIGITRAENGKFDVEASNCDIETLIGFLEITLKYHRKTALVTEPEPNSP